MDNIILVVGSVITMIGGTGYFTFLFAKGKYQQEVNKLEVEVLQAKKAAETTDIENDSKVVDLYKDALNDLPERYEEKYRHVEEMAKQVEKLFEKKEAILMQEIDYHKKQAALYKKMYDDKVREFNKYKKEHP
jgi:flagellar basal body-associated protein FliL